MAITGTFLYCPPGTSLYAGGTGSVKCFDSSTSTYSVVQPAAGVLVSPDEFSSLNALLANQAPFDYTLAGAFWAWGFTAVLALYFGAHVIGLVLKQVRTG